jgi:hypothetical protein
MGFKGATFGVPESARPTPGSHAKVMVTTGCNSLKSDTTDKSF